MIKLLNALENIGIAHKEIEDIRASGDRLAALILIALYDDRHEYVD